MTPEYNENLERAIGTVLANQMEKADRGFSLIEARFATILADLRAARAEDEARIIKFVDGLRATAEERIAAASSALEALPVPKDGASVTTEDVAPMIEELVSARFAEINERSLAAIEAAAAAIPTPKDGVSVTVDDVTPLLQALVDERVAAIEASAVESVSRAVSGIPEVKDGTSVTVEDVAPIIERLTSEEAAKIPVMVKDAVEQTISALPKPKDGESVTVQDVTPLIERLVDERVQAESLSEVVKQAAQEAVAAIPAPKDGLDGKVDRAEPWAMGVHYARQVRTHAGGTWQAIKDTASEPPHPDWQCLSAPGAQGPAMEVRGAFDGDSSYRAHDVVLLNGSSFVAVQNEPGACPGPGWKLLASAGGRGKQGDPGKPGAPGKPGRDGSDVIALHLDGARIVLTMADGVEHIADLSSLLGIER